MKMIKLSVLRTYLILSLSIIWSLVTPFVLLPFISKYWEDSIELIFGLSFVMFLLGLYLVTFNTLIITIDKDKMSFNWKHNLFDLWKDIPTIKVSEILCVNYHLKDKSVSGPMVECLESIQTKSKLIQFKRMKINKGRIRNTDELLEFFNNHSEIEVKVREPDIWSHF